MNTTQPTQYGATVRTADQQILAAQREIDSIIECAHHLFADVSERRVDEIESIRCERGEPVWYQPHFRSERESVALFDSLHAKMKGVVENMSAHLGQGSHQYHDQPAFFKERLARAEVPHEAKELSPSRVRIGLYAAKLIARRLTT